MNNLTEGSLNGAVVLYCPDRKTTTLTTCTSDNVDKSGRVNVACKETGVFSKYVKFVHDAENGTNQTKYIYKYYQNRRGDHVPTFVQLRGGKYYKVEFDENDEPAATDDVFVNEADVEVVDENAAADEDDDATADCNAGANGSTAKRRKTMNTNDVVYTFIDQFKEFSHANPQAASDLARLLTIHMNDDSNQKVTELPDGLTSFDDLHKNVGEMDKSCGGIFDSICRNTCSIGVLLAKQQHTKEVEEKKKEEEVAGMYETRSSYLSFLERARYDSEISSEFKEKVTQRIKGIDEKLESIDKDLKSKYEDEWKKLNGHFIKPSEPSVETKNEWKAFIETNHFAA